MQVRSGAAAALLVALGGLALGARVGESRGAARSRVFNTVSRPAPVALGPALRGTSGALRVKMALPGERLRLPLAWDGGEPGDAWYRWLPALGTAGEAGAHRPLAPGGVARAPERPGVYDLQVGAGEEEVTFQRVRLLVQVPFDGASGYVRGYYIGRYPAGRRGRYRPPAALVEVTRANEELPLSEHLRLRDFLTHDQAAVWPKYAIVQPRLLEKLELVMAALNERGIPAHRLHVMSGYRTPQYNRRGLGSGRAVLSRHQYGDAADVWVDDDGDGIMDDLNGDGRHDIRDAAVMLRAVEAVERRHPELIGGAGTYHGNGAHGPFIHIDARGRRARWGGARGE